VKEAREAWMTLRRELPPGRTWFLDESASTTNMTRLRAWSNRGERATCKEPAGHWKVVSMIGAITARGVGAAMSLEGAVDGEAFTCFVREVLAPRLASGDVVVMDNLSSHKVEGVSELIERAGAKLLYLPPYSPDFNPIEPIWSKVKKILRELGARTVEALHEAIAVALAAVTAEDCRGCVAERGYAT
jgi:transposase